MSLRTGFGPRSMVGKLLEVPSDSDTELLRLRVDQVAITTLAQPGLNLALSRIERHPDVALAIAYCSATLRAPGEMTPLPADVQLSLRRLGILKGRPGTGFPGSVHLERFGAPGRVLLTDDPRMTLLGGLGMLAIPTTSAVALESLGTGSIAFPCPKVVQIFLSGRLSPSVSARDAYLELLRQGLASTTAALGASNAPVILEFAGPGLRTLTVQERAVLCSIAPQVSAMSAVAASDEKTELFLRDQRRSKAHRQLSPDAGSSAAAVHRLDLSQVEPLVQLPDGSIVPAYEIDARPVHEIVLGGDVSGTLRDMLCAVQWFKAKRAHLDIDLLVVPATRQTLEAMAASEVLTQLLSAGARLHVPDPAFLTAAWHPPGPETSSLRSFAPTVAVSAQQPTWMLASIETLCQAAITGRIQDPRLVRRAAKVSCPRELPIDDCWLIDRRPAVAGGNLSAPGQSALPSRAPEWDGVPASAQ